MEQTYEEILRGTVLSVTFQNTENGYTVLRMKTEEGQTVNVVGTLPMTMSGERLVVTGHWGKHPTYGEQFQAELLERLMPETKNEILSYLSSRIIKGIGERTAQKIVDRFGERTLEVLENEPQKLTEIYGITEKKAAEINESFCRQVGIRRLIEFLNSYHLPAELAMRVYRVYRELSVDAMQDNPYLLTDRFFGASFSTVDAFAIQLGVESDDARRVEAGILFELNHNLSNGHVFLPAEKLIAATAKMLSLEPACVEEQLGELDETGSVVTELLCGVRAVYLPEYYEAERFVSERICAMAETKYPEPEGLSQKVMEIEKELGIDYAQLQRKAIGMAALRQLMILTGGPGTGKTTTVNGILELFDRMNLKTQLAAPTGRAAKRLSELSGRDAATIHRLLEAQYNQESGEMEFYHDESEPLSIDALVVDETSMVDLQLMQSLLRALKPDCRLILVGDPNQLPSVGAGNVFSDLIRSGAVETVCLTEIFRQAQQSLIVLNAHAVNRGELPELTAKNRDFFFMKRRSAESVAQTIQDLCQRRLPENMGIPAEDIQVLSPSRRYETGTAELNRRLQEALNPPKPGLREKPFGNFIFREGDRVMQIRNNYDIMWKKLDGAGSGAGIFNGDIGKITSINLQEETMTVRFDDHEAEYGFDMLSELELAYAMTVHKSQGSEYRAVILSVYGGFPRLMTRSVLYTAITRARELLILVGDEQVVASMTQNNLQHKRYSGLKIRISKGGA